MFPRSFAFALLSLSLSACVSIDQLPPGALPNQTSGSSVQSYPDVPEPAATLNSSHFQMRGEREYDVRMVSVAAESIYGQVVNSLGLYTAMSGKTYRFIVYPSAEQFEAKTKLPAATRVVGAGDALYSYPGPGVEPPLAFELTSLMLNQYLDRSASQLKWLVEGAALNQQLAQLPEGERSAFRNLQSATLRKSRQPFQQMTFFVPTSRADRLKDAWYMQTESVVAYLINQGSALNFSAFLNSLRAGADADQALAANYPGKFRSMAELENTWKYSL